MAMLIISQELFLLTSVNMNIKGTHKLFRKLLEETRNNSLPLVMGNGPVLKLTRGV